MAKNNNLIAMRLSKTHFIGRILARLPFVRCVILNGSLAQGRSNESSDIDILIIAKSGHIFTARFFVNFFASILRIKRPKDEKKDHSGKFCFNYFLTENYLKIPTGRGEEMDRYCADNYSHSKFIAGDISLFNKFILVNQGLFSKYNCHPEASAEGSSERNERAAAPRFFTNVQNDIQKIAERLFRLRFENWAKHYQIKKINTDPRTKKYPELIVFNDKELRFHPPKLTNKN
jgi:predicted nucleotidyltransferase